MHLMNVFKSATNILSNIFILLLIIIKFYFKHIMFFRKNNILYDIIIELFKLKIFVPYHQEFIANFMIYLSSFTKQTNSFTNVGIIY